MRATNSYCQDHLESLEAQKDQPAKLDANWTRRRAELRVELVKAMVAGASADPNCVQIIPAYACDEAEKIADEIIKRERSENEQCADVAR